jgi:hypothetical protein
MRTTLTLDPDVVRLVEDAAHEQRRSRKDVINDALRRALMPSGSVPREPYQLTPHHAQVRPGIDPARLNQLADELEDQAILEATGRPR